MHTVVAIGGRAIIIQISIAHVVIPMVAIADVVVSDIAGASVVAPLCPSQGMGISIHMALFLVD